MANKIILLILSALLLRLCSCESKINLTVAGWSLASNHTITSPNGSFALGFFSISNRFYAGIWYAKMQNKTKIWIANRNNPASLNASLQFSGNGDLRLVEPNGTVIWSAGTAGKNVSSLALEEVGNLILYGHNNSRTVWQSFEHPTDTWVVGAKMYVGSNITSWQATDQPAAGRYSLKIMQDSSYRSIWNGSVQYWSSGIWTGNTFVNIPELTLGYKYDFSLVNSSQSSNGLPYFSWSEKDPSAHYYSYLTIESDGVVRVKFRVQNDAWFIAWEQPKDVCHVERLCGQFGICKATESPACSCPSGFVPADYDGWTHSDWSQGCVLNQSLSCSQTSDFVTLSQTSYQTNSSGVVGLQISASSCKNRCLQNCSCVAYSYDNSGSGECYLYGENNAAYNGKTPSSTFSTSYLKIAGTKPKSSSKRGIILGVSVGLFLVALLLGFIIWFQRRRQKFAYVSGLQTFTYRDLKSATWNFKQPLGAGGFGTVYKGKLYDKSLVAVKMLTKREDPHGEKGFRAEVSTIGKIQHKNLVRLRGYCADSGHRLLVYEYVEGGSLNSYLFSTNDAEAKPLDWITRFNIALGTARALAYLHEECKDCIIHCDIKPENILLDKDLSPKVSDFGLAKLVGRNFSRVLTSIKGTLGYLAPEWLSGVPITAKADVFSYGMTLLEILCGRKNIKLQEDVDKIFFPLWVINQMKAGNIETVIDPRLQGSFDRVQAVMLLRLCIWCIQDEESERPSMGRVVQMLEGSVPVEEPPVPKSYLMFDM